jgi:CBS domain containing-hemolysin-like protein
LLFCFFFFFFFADFALTEFRLGKDSWGGYKRALHCPFLVTNHAALPTALLLTVQPLNLATKRLTSKSISNFLAAS